MGKNEEKVKKILQKIKNDVTISENEKKTVTINYSITFNEGGIRAAKRGSDNESVL